MIPARYAPILFGFILSRLMSSIVSAIANYRVLDASLAFLGPWLASWMSS